MGYHLQAVVAAKHVLDELAGGIAGARVVPLGQHLSLLPVTEEYHDAVTVPGADRIDAFRGAPAGFADLLAAYSAAGPVAYVEAAYFGGTGSQAAQVWDRGRSSLGPLVHDGSAPVAGLGPISQALRRLGADAGAHADEFDALGLGRHRRTEDWFTTAS